MKRFFRFSIPILMLILIGSMASCGAGSKGKSADAGLSEEFFSAEIKGEITVSAYDSMIYKSFLEDAARAFEAQYPGTKVNVETFSVMPEVRTGGSENTQMVMVQMQDDPQGRADYLSRVNTNLMSGTGADIYAMDVLPVYKFVENGALENLGAYMEMDPDFNPDDYRQNILNAVRFQGGLWFLPMDYDFNYFTYDAAIVPSEITGSFGIDKSFSVESLINKGKSFYDGTYKLFNMFDFSRGPRSIFSMLLKENIQSFLNLETKKANFTDGRFTALLNSVKNYSEIGLIPQEVTGQQNAGQMRQRYMDAPADRYYFKQYNAVNLISQFTRNLGMIMRRVEGGMAAGIDSDDEIAGIEANADGSIPFTYSEGYGINSQSKNKLLAWTFIKFLLSKEMQLSTNIFNRSLPINNEARAEKAANSFSGFFRRNTGGTLNEQQMQALEQYKAAVERLSDSINCFVIQDVSLNDMISQEVRYFSNGTRTAEEVARVLQNKAELYLNE